MPFTKPKVLQKLRLLLEYDGSSFSGWQAQHQRSTIEGALRQALSALAVDCLDLRVAGRTDAGVHAIGQVVSFHTHYAAEARRLAPALNKFLPKTVRVQLAEQVASNFDARNDSCGKHYRYTVVHSRHPSALWQHRAWHVRHFLPQLALSARAQILVGHHDFNAFRSRHCDATHARRTITALNIHTYDLGTLTFTAFDLFANAFCRHMCRIIVGTLVEHTIKQLPNAALKQVLASRDRCCAGVTAPAMGLCLIAVFYHKLLD